VDRKVGDRGVILLGRERVKKVKGQFGAACYSARTKIINRKRAFKNEI